MGANIRYDNLFDVWHRKGNLDVECPCGRRSVVDAGKMYRWYILHNWDTRMSRLYLHLCCTRCGGRCGTVQPTGALPNAPDRFPANEREWEMLIRRLRS